MPTAFGWPKLGEISPDAEDGILTDKRYLIHDRDPLFAGVDGLLNYYYGNGA